MESPCSWPENSTSDRAKAVEELVKGRDFALRLRCLLNKPSSSSSSENNNNDVDGVVQNQDLVLKILSSFTNTLSILTNGGGDHHQYYQSDEVSQIQTNATHFSWEAARKSEDSGESCKSTSIVKDRRGCYKRRKCSDSWINDSPNLVDDGYAWRKYGQKEILNAKYPRNYFRCTHKHDQGCMATKQVQRIQEDPPLHRTTYSGHHTCKNLLKASQLFMDSSRDHNNSPMISFCDKETNINNSNNPFLSSFPFIKQEYKDDQEIMPSHADDHHHHHDPITHNYQSESSDHYLLSPDHDHQLTTYDSGVVNSSSLSCTDMGALVVDSVVNFDDDDDLLHQVEF